MSEILRGHGPAVLPEMEHETLAWYDPTNKHVSTDKNDPMFTPLGQLWPLDVKREWVSLTDEDTKYIIGRWIGMTDEEILGLDRLDDMYFEGEIELIHKAEALLKGKNT